LPVAFGFQSFDLLTQPAFYTSRVHLARRLQSKVLNLVGPSAFTVLAASVRAAPSSSNSTRAEKSPLRRASSVARISAVCSALRPPLVLDINKYSVCAVAC
jgi:hypothetical protein